MTGRKEPLRWAVLGPGNAARTFARDLVESGVGVVESVAGGRDGRAEAFCADLGGKPCADASTALDGVEAAYVAAPHPAHAGLVRLALERGVPVLCEKPLTVGPEDALELTELARERDTPLVEGWMYRCHPQFSRALELVTEGVLGPLVAIEAHLGLEVGYDPEHRLFDPDRGGGSVLELGGFPLSFALAVARAGGDAEGSPELADASGELVPTRVDRHARGTFAFRGGLRAELQVALGKELGSGATVRGERGRLVLEEPFHPGGRCAGGPGRLSVETPEGHHDEVVEADENCLVREARELTRLARKRAAGRARSVEVEPRAPMVGHAESVELARLLALWRGRVGVRA